MAMNVSATIGRPYALRCCFSAKNSTFEAKKGVMSGHRLAIYASVSIALRSLKPKRSTISIGASDALAERTYSGFSGQSLPLMLQRTFAARAQAAVVAICAGRATADDPIPARDRAY